MITWIPVDKDLPKQHERKDGDGRKYKSSNLVLIWTTDKEQPLDIGCLEDDKWFIHGIGGYDSTVTHWALINGPDGHLVDMEYC